MGAVPAPSAPAGLLARPEKRIADLAACLVGIRRCICGPDELRKLVRELLRHSWGSQCGHVFVASAHAWPLFLDGNIYHRFYQEMVCRQSGPSITHDRPNTPLHVARHKDKVDGCEVLVG